MKKSLVIPALISIISGASISQSLAARNIHQNIQLTENWIKEAQDLKSKVNTYYKNKDYDDFYNYINDLNRPNKKYKAMLSSDKSVVNYNEYYGDINSSDILYNGKQLYDLSAINNIVGNKAEANIIKKGFYIDKNSEKLACDENKINWNALPNDIAQQKESIIDLSLSELNQTALKVVPMSDIKPIKKPGITDIKVEWALPLVLRVYLSESLFQKIINFINFNKGSNADIITGIFTILVTAAPALEALAAALALVIVILFVDFMILQEFDQGNGVAFDSVNGILVDGWAQ